MAPANFYSLPYELHSLISDRLDYASLARLRCVSAHSLPVYTEILCRRIAKDIRRAYLEDGLCKANPSPPLVAIESTANLDTIRKIMAYLGEDGTAYAIYLFAALICEHYTGRPPIFNNNLPRTTDKTLPILSLLAKHIETSNEELKAVIEAPIADTSPYDKRIVLMRKAVEGIRHVEVLELLSGIDFGEDENWRWALSILCNRKTPNLLGPFLEQRNLNPFDYYEPSKGYESLFLATFFELSRFNSPEMPLLEAGDMLLEKRWRDGRPEITREILPTFLHGILTALFDPSGFSLLYESILSQTLNRNPWKTLRLLKYLSRILSITDRDQTERYEIDESTTSEPGYYGHSFFLRNPQALFWILLNWNNLDSSKYTTSDTKLCRRTLVDLLLSKSSQPHVLAQAGGFYCRHEVLVGGASQIITIQLPNALPFILPTDPEMYGDFDGQTNYVTPEEEEDQIWLARKLLDYGVCPYRTRLSVAPDVAETVAERLVKNGNGHLLEQICRYNGESKRPVGEVLGDEGWEKDAATLLGSGDEKDEGGASDMGYDMEGDEYLSDAETAGCEDGVLSQIEEGIEKEIEEEVDLADTEVSTIEDEEDIWMSLSWGDGDDNEDAATHAEGGEGAAGNSSIGSQTSTHIGARSDEWGLILKAVEGAEPSAEDLVDDMMGWKIDWSDDDTATIAASKQERGEDFMSDTATLVDETQSASSSIDRSSCQCVEASKGSEWEVVASVEDRNQKGKALEALGGGYYDMERDEDGCFSSESSAGG